MSPDALDPGAAGSQLKDSLADASRRVQSIIDEAEQTSREVQLKARADAEREAERLVESRIAQMDQVTAPLFSRIELLQAQVAELSREIDEAGKNMRAMVASSGADTGAQAAVAATEPEVVVADPPPAVAYGTPEVAEAPPAPEAVDGPPVAESTSVEPEFADAVAYEEPAPVAYPGTTPQESSGPPDSSASVASAPVETEAPSSPPQEAVLRATQMAVAGSTRADIEATLQTEFGLPDAKSVVDDILGTS